MIQSSQNLPTNEQGSVKENRARNVRAIDFPRRIIFKGPVQILKILKMNYTMIKSNKKRQKYIPLDYNYLMSKLKKLEVIYILKNILKVSKVYI